MVMHRSLPRFSSVRRLTRCMWSISCVGIKDIFTGSAIQPSYLWNHETRRRTPVPLVPTWCRLVEDCRPSARSTAMPQLDTHDPHIANIFRRATLERNNQDKRLADIFG